MMCSSFCTPVLPIAPPCVTVNANPFGITSVELRIREREDFSHRPAPLVVDEAKMEMRYIYVNGIGAWRDVPEDVLKQMENWKEGQPIYLNP